MLGRAGAWATAIQNAVATAEGGKYVRTTRFVSISSGTSGTIALPSNSQVILDDFGGTVDAVVLQMSGGKPTAIPALTSSGVIVATTFDTNGNWAFSGTPVSYPVAIVYRVQTQLAAFDSTSLDIWGEPGQIGTAPVAEGGTGLSSFSLGDFLYASAANVLSALAGNSTATKKFLTMTSSTPGWNTISGSDLPTPGASSLGGVNSLAAVAHKFLTQIGTDGTITAAQPAFTDISGAATSSQLPTPVTTGALVLNVDGGGNVITTGQKGYITIPFACTIQSVTMIADQVGSCVVDIWKAAYPTIPTVANTIAASALPTLSSSQKSQDTTLTGWTTAVSAGDVLGFNVNSVSTITRLNLVLKVAK